MYPITEEEISDLREDNIEELSKLDARGILLAPGETISEFKKRLTVGIKTSERINNELNEKGYSELFKGFRVDKKLKITKDILNRAAKVTKNRYAFNINWVPAFYASKSMGPLWGGCAITFPEDEYAVFIIRKDFMKKEKWLIYDRNELLAHEICHIARAPIHDDAYEEHFAYSISQSALRRSIGNCFQRQIDALLFVIPVFLLLFVQFYQIITQNYFSLAPFWTAAALPPLFLLTRNYYLKIIFNLAEKRLRNAGIKNTSPLLFRCTKSEITALSKLKDRDEMESFLKEKNTEDLRWQVITDRFINHQQPKG